MKCPWCGEWEGPPSEYASHLEECEEAAEHLWELAKKKKARRVELPPLGKLEVPPAYTNRAIADLRAGQAGPIEIRNHTNLDIVVETFQSPTSGQFFIDIHRVVMPYEREVKPEDVPYYEIVRRRDFLQPNIKPTGKLGQSSSSLKTSRVGSIADIKTKIYSVDDNLDRLIGVCRKHSEYLKKDLTVSYAVKENTWVCHE